VSKNLLLKPPLTSKKLCLSENSKFTS